MDRYEPFSAAMFWFAWPLQMAEVAAQALAAWPRLAPDALAQAINPGWSFAPSLNINSNNSSAPETEYRVVAEHSYGRQIGRIMDVVALLADDLASRNASLSGDSRLADFRELKSDVDAIKARAATGRLERIAADLEALRRTDPAAYEELKKRLRELVSD